jgi:hypothetical protein
MWWQTHKHFRKRAQCRYPRQLKFERY